MSEADKVDDDVVEPKIVRRSISMNLDGVDSIWVPEDHFASMVLNVCHLLLPQAELWMCRTFNKAKPLITDRVVLQEVKGFIGQEGAHAQGHAKVMEHFEKLGWDFTAPRKALDTLFDGWMGDKVACLIPVFGPFKTYWLIMRIGMIAIIEHLTSVLGTWMIDNEGLENSGTDKQMLNLFKWHAAEEVEHRAVAHDLYNHLGGSRLLIKLMYLPGIIIVLLLWRWASRKINREENGNTFKYGFRNYIKSSKRGHLPTVRYLVVSIMRYLRWGFHPGQLGSTSRAKEVLSELEYFWEYDDRASSKTN